MMKANLVLKQYFINMERDNLLYIFKTIQCIVFYLPKVYIYLERDKMKKIYTSFNVNFLQYLSQLKHALKVEEIICTKKNMHIKNKLNIMWKFVKMLD